MLNLTYFLQNKQQLGEIQAFYEYKNMEGKLIFCTARVEDRITGKKSGWENSKSIF